MSFDINKAMQEFNTMYGMSCNTIPTIPKEYSNTSLACQRIEQVTNMLNKEVVEGKDIVDKLCLLPDYYNDDLLTDLADWYGDIIIYCASEMTRLGLDINQVLTIICDSNKSKMGADGKPIFVNGKLEKGPNYWKPEPKLKEYINNASK